MTFSKSILTYSVLCLAVFAGAAKALDKPEFPRLGGVLNGNPRNYDDATYQRAIAKLDIALIANFPGFTPGGAPLEASLKKIKALNPNTLIFGYVNAFELPDTVSSDAWNALREKLNSERWWLYAHGTSGTAVRSNFGPKFGSINISLNTRPDSSGNRSIEWMTKFYVDNLAKPNPSMDGFFTDNVVWRPRIDGDWNLDGTADAETDPKSAAWVRQGYARYFTLLNQMLPDKMQIANIDWGRREAVYPELKGLPKGGLMEGLIGKSYSVEGWAGWNGLLAWYRKTMTAVSDPKLVIFNQSGDINDFKSLRYGMATCLMDDGYFAFNELSKGYSGVAWFDEFDAKLGQATSEPPTSDWQKGVYRRDFQNGIALVNPKGNGTVTVTLEGDFRRLSGAREHTVNNGQVVRSVTLSDRDGIILMRTSAPVAAPAKPAAPQSVVVE